MPILNVAKIEDFKKRGFIVITCGLTKADLDLTANMDCSQSQKES